MPAQTRIIHYYVCLGAAGGKEWKVNELIRNDIVPIVNLFHFDLPQGLIDQYKGFVSRRCIEDFVNYAHVCFESFWDRVPYLLTINEQDVIANIPFFNGLIDINHSFQLG